MVSAQSWGVEYHFLYTINPPPAMSAIECRYLWCVMMSGVWDTIFYTQLIRRSLLVIPPVKAFGRQLNENPGPTSFPGRAPRESPGEPTWMDFWVARWLSRLLR